MRLGDLGGQSFIVFTCYIISLWYIRGFLWGEIDYQLNKSAVNKRAKGQTFKEWLMFSRYRDAIPKILLSVYFLILGMHPLAFIFCVISHFIKPLDGFGPIIAKGIFWFDGVLLLIIQLLFWQAKPGFKYERWIKKKKGNKK